MIDVLIAGGGISGLVAARDLVRRGRRIRLVEARARLGGLILTEEVEGFTIEAGPDSLLMTKPSAAALCAELGLTLVPTLAPRTAFILRDGDLHAIPRGSVLGLPATPAAIEQASMLSAAGRARLMRDLTAPQPPATGGADGDESIGAVIRRRFGDEAVRYLAQPLLGGIHAGDVERLSMRALFPRIAALDGERGSLLKALAPQHEDPESRGKAAREKATRSHAAQGHAAQGQAAESETAPGQAASSLDAPSLDADGLFRSIPGGLGTLVAAVARDLPADSISVNTSVVRLDSQPAPGGGFVATLSNGEAVNARAIVLASPAYSIATLAAPIDSALATLCRAISYSSSATITLAYGRDTVERPLAGSGFVVPRGETATRLLATSWVTSKWAARAPADMVMLRAFAGGTLDLDLLDRDDDDLVARAHADLTPLLGLRERPRLAKVYRWMRAGPQYEVGHLARVAAIERRLTLYPGLFVAGSGFRGIGIPDTVADARAIAEQIDRWLITGAAGSVDPLMKD